MSATGKLAAVSTSHLEAGSTLLEMLVVVGIMGLIAGLVFPDVLRPLQSVQLNHARTVLLADLRTAHAAAIRRGATVQFEIDDRGTGYGWDHVRVALRPPLRIEADNSAIGFFPDGTSAGGAMSLADGRRRVGIRIDAGGTAVAL